MVVDYLAGQLGIADASSVKRYAERQSTQWEHAAEIRQAYGYRDFTDDGRAAGASGVHRGAGLDADGGAAGAVRPGGGVAAGARRCCCPGASVLARLVAEVRARRERTACTRSWPPPRRGRRRAARSAGRACWTCRTGSRVSELERLRRSPVRASAPQMVRSLDRASELLAIGAGKADLAGVPANRVEALARYGLATKAPALRGLAEPRRTATLLATARAPGGRRGR